MTEGNGFCTFDHLLLYEIVKSRESREWSVLSLGNDHSKTKTDYGTSCERMSAEVRDLDQLQPGLKVQIC